MVAHRHIAIWRAVKVKVNKLLQVHTHNLINVNSEDDLLEVHREENIKEKNLVSPDDALFLLLRSEP